MSMLHLLDWLPLKQMMLQISFSCRNYLNEQCPNAFFCWRHELCCICIFIFTFIHIFFSSSEGRRRAVADSSDCVICNSRLKACHVIPPGNWRGSITGVTNLWFTEPWGKHLLPVIWTAYKTGLFTCAYRWRGFKKKKKRKVGRGKKKKESKDLWALSNSR